MNRVIVFSGPTLNEKEVLAHLPGAACWGPAARGDVYRATLEDPCAIGLIDGYFEHRPAVTHKEILWAISRGVAVFGAASMGALRAAELHQLGMIGGGAIFADLAAGRLEDDDEVAVVHTDAEHGYRAGSEAMVNVRATMAAALRAGVVAPTLAQVFLECAKGLFYPARNYARVIEELRSLGHDGAQLKALQAWLAVPAHRVDQKRLDALEMLETMREWRETRVREQPRPHWTLPNTSAFSRLREEVDAQVSASRSRLLTEEIQLLGPETYAEIMTSASLRALAVLLDSEGERAPRPANRTSHVEFAEQERRILQHMPRVHELVLAEVESVLRALGDLERVAARAAKKATLCADLGSPHPGELNESVEAYFQAVLRRELPVDIGSFARSVGFSSVASFNAAVRRELTFLRKLSLGDGE